MNLTRRSLITLSATGTLTLAGCSSSSSKKTTTTSGTSAAASSTPATATITPVKGFATTPAWTQPDRSGTPLADLGAAWSQEHAWFCSQVTESAFTINAYNPTTKQLVTSEPQTGDPSHAQLYPVVSPAEGLIVYTPNGVWVATISGGKIITKTAKTPSDSINKPQWMGDAFFIPPYANDVDADPTNTAKPQPAQVFDTAQGEWVTVRPKNTGMTVVALTRINGQQQTVEVNTNKWTQQSQIKVGSNTGAVPGFIVFALSGKLVTTSQNGLEFTPVDEHLKPNTAGAWKAADTPGFSPVALSPDRLSAIMPEGQRYDAAKNTITTGTSTSNMIPQWALINTAVTSNALYANSNPDSGAVQDASAGSFTGTTTIPANPDPKTQAPTLVMPDDSGLFSTATGWVALPSSH